MANEQHGPLSVIAAVDLSATMYRGVVLGSTGLGLPGAGAAIFGIQQNKGAAGKMIKVECRAGYRSIAISGAACVKGDKLKVDATGKFVPATANEIGVATCFEGASAADRRISVVLLASGALGAAGMGVDDIVLGTTAPSALTRTTFAQVTGTKTGALAAGLYPGQVKSIVQSVAATSPIGTITGAFKTLAGAAATTLALGTAVGHIVDVIWDGAAWRAMHALGGTGSSLA